MEEQPVQCHAQEDARDARPRDFESEDNSWKKIVASNCVSNEQQPPRSDRGGEKCWTMQVPFAMSQKQLLNRNTREEGDYLWAISQNAERQHLLLSRLWKRSKSQSAQAQVQTTKVSYRNPRDPFRKLNCHKLVKAHAHA